VAARSGRAAGRSAGAGGRQVERRRNSTRGGRGESWREYWNRCARLAAACGDRGEAESATAEAGNSLSTCVGCGRTRGRLADAPTAGRAVSAAAYGDDRASRQARSSTSGESDRCCRPAPFAQSGLPRSGPPRSLPRGRPPARMPPAVAAPACRQCGSNSVVPIVYGRPGPELVKQAQEGQVKLAGCAPRAEKWHCKACKADFKPPE
jgi:hypothetical protein